MVPTITRVEGKQKRHLVELVGASNDFKVLSDHFEDWMLDEQDVAHIEYQNGETRYAVSFLSTDRSSEEQSEIVAMVEAESIESLVASINHYENSQLITSEMYWIEDGQIRSQATPDESALTRPSSSTSGAACHLCRLLYKFAREAVRNGVRSGDLSAPFLCLAAENDIIDQLGPDIHKNHCISEAENIVDFVENAGISRTPRSVCQSIGSCP